MSIQTEIFNLNCNNTIIYIILLIIFGILNGVKHYVHAMATQLHREAMTESAKSNKRAICKIIGIRAGIVLIHIIDILIISKSNFGILVVAFSSDLIGTSWVYAWGRADHHHPIRSLSKAIQHYNSLEEEIRLLTTLKRAIPENKLKEKRILDEYIKNIHDFMILKNKTKELTKDIGELDTTSLEGIRF